MRIVFVLVDLALSSNSLRHGVTDFSNASVIGISSDSDAVQDFWNSVGIFPEDHLNKIKDEYHLSTKCVDLEKMFQKHCDYSTRPLPPIPGQVVKGTVDFPSDESNGSVTVNDPELCFGESLHGGSVECECNRGIHPELSSIDIGSATANQTRCSCCWTCGATCLCCITVAKSIGNFCIIDFPNCLCETIFPVGGCLDEYCCMNRYCLMDISECLCCCALAIACGPCLFVVSRQ
jgi:hypothetical protein